MAQTWDGKEWGQMTGYSALTEELMSTLEESPRRLNQEMMGGVQLGEMAVIRLLAEHSVKEPMAAGEISSRLKMTTSRIAAVLNSLEKKRLLVREADPRDRRRVLVSLTKEGMAIFEKRRAEGRRRARRFLEKMGEEDAATFVRLMKKMQNILSTSENRD